MSLESGCNQCGSQIEVGSDQYCEECFNKLQDEIEDLRKALEDERSESASLSKQLYDLERQ